MSPNGQSTLRSCVPRRGIKTEEESRQCLRSKFSSRSTFYFWLLDFRNEFSNRITGKFMYRIASSWCKLYQTPYFKCHTRPGPLVFHKLFNTTVEIVQLNARALL